MELKQDETGKAVVPVLACVLKQLCDRNDRLPVSGKAISKFHAQRPPAITIFDYLHRIARYALCSGECFVLALVYVDRIIQQNPTFVVNSLNIHRLLITSVMLAAKFFDDQYFNNAYYAKVGGVPANEMNSLEVEFLFMTNFSLFVTTDTYRQYYQELWNHAHSSTVCGCASAKVPGLVLTFEAEERERRRRVKQMRQAQADEGESEDNKGGQQQKALQRSDGSVGSVAASSVAGSAEPEAMQDSPPSRPQAASRPAGKQDMIGSVPQNGGVPSEPRRSGRRHGPIGQAPVAMVASSPVGVG
jgi:hypothetical protein